MHGQGSGRSSPPCARAEHGALVKAPRAAASTGRADLSGGRPPAPHIDGEACGDERKGKTGEQSLPEVDVPHRWAAAAPVLSRRR